MLARFFEGGDNPRREALIDLSLADCGKTASSVPGVNDGSVAWRGAALARNRPTRDICLGACRTKKFVKQAAPVNVSTQVRFVGTGVDQSFPTQRWAKQRVR